MKLGVGEVRLLRKGMELWKEEGRVLGNVMVLGAVEGGDL